MTTLFISDLHLESDRADIGEQFFARSYSDELGGIDRFFVLEFES